jgi:prophage DNA circulation protein
MNITDLAKNSPWRAALQPASYKGAEFHVEAMGEDRGRRLVEHEFPKKDTPYAEDMGRRAMRYTVRGYIITFGRDTDKPLYQRDYRIARDRLRGVLDQGGAGRLQLPTIAPVIVACHQYRMMEESREGGYCAFDMSFVEQGQAPGPPPPSTRDGVVQQSLALAAQIVVNLGGP